MRGPDWLKKVAKKGITIARTPFSSDLTTIRNPQAKPVVR